MEGENGLIRILIVGAGAGGKRLVEALVGHPEVTLVGVVDVNRTAPGMLLAEQFGIPTSADYLSLLPELQPEAVNVILEVTGSSEVYQHLLAVAPSHATVISGLALRFFTLLIDDKISLIHQLEERQQELQSILNAAHDGMIGINWTGRVTLFNAAAGRLTGVSVEQAIGQNIDALIPNSRLSKVLISGQAELNQVQQLNNIEIVTNRMPVRDESGAVIGAIAVFRDVTELRQLAAEVTNLREIQTLLEAIIQSTQDAISAVDKDGIGILINPAYTRLTGLTPQEVVGKPADVDIAEGDSMHLQVLKTKKPVKNVPMKVGPRRREVLVDVAPILVNQELRGSVGVIHDISEIKRLTEELERANKLIRSMQAKYTFDDVIGASPVMLMAIEQARRAASTPATVLLRGESGTGKELFAHAIHHASERRYHPFVRVNCAALSETLLESELFGYEEGAFTGAKRGGKKGLFEEASGGTLFLDEIGEMNLSTQAKLLRAVQEREVVRVGGVKPISVDVRLIVATHVNLEHAVAVGKFREDLYYRLNVIPIVIPPLRYRQEDIKGIAMHILHKQNQAFGRNVETISESTIEVLQDYSWPGNVRELENTIGRAMINMNFQETVLMAHHLPVLQHNANQTPARVAQDVGVSQFALPVRGRLQDIVREAERLAIEHALQDAAGNKTEAARRLGISVRSLYYKMNADEPGIGN